MRQKERTRLGVGFDRSSLDVLFSLPKTVKDAHTIEMQQLRKTPKRPLKGPNRFDDFIVCFIVYSTTRSLWKSTNEKKHKRFSNVILTFNGLVQGKVCWHNT